MPHLSGRPALWAGPECTFNRVGDRFFDQLSLSGHDARLDDLDRIASLGVTAVRYPILWERHCSEPIDWSWADSRLSRLLELNIEPIVGLVHHGSGPEYTSLVDGSFATGLAAFAEKVARRFPWVKAFTPVNEPLTTARFSGLYGHWYPHGRDDRTFARCLVTQCRAVVLAMQAIRSINPEAALVQTEDLSRTHAAAALRYQAEFENERRWLTWDLLCGRVDTQHALWGYLRRAGISHADLAWFLDNPCAPDVIGANYYVTSERYLDDRTANYPAEMEGTNGRHLYVDTEAVRVLPAGADGPFRLMWEVWKRYSLPVAFTEVHLGCTPDEQVRWFWEVWQAAMRLRAKGADVRAVTTWSVFGAYDWDSLVTQPARHYEAGVFDVRQDPPHATPVADLIRDLAAGRKPMHYALGTPGWWHQPERLLFHCRSQESA